MTAPHPVEDGAINHLLGSMLPELTLPATTGTLVNLGAQTGWWVLYCYTQTGRPGVPLPPLWDTTPGAHGSTPQSEAFRDHYADFSSLSVRIFGLSTQSTEWQREAAARLQLPFPLLSDAHLQLRDALGLPVFQAGSAQWFYKRLTLIARGRTVRKVFYPVDPPEGNAAEVLAWLRTSGRLHD